MSIGDYGQVLKPDVTLDQLAHDMKDPIVAMSNVLELHDLERDGVRKNRKALAVVRNEVAWMVQFVDQLLELARARAGRVTMRPQVVFLHDLVTEIADDTAVQAHSRGKVIEVDGHSSVDCISLVDEALTFRLVTLLLRTSLQVAHGRIVLIAQGGAGQGAPRIKIILDAAMAQPGSTPVDGNGRAYLRHSDRHKGITGLELYIARALAAVLGVELSIKKIHQERTEIEVRFQKVSRGTGS